MIPAESVFFEIFERVVGVGEFGVADPVFQWSAAHQRFVLIDGVGQDRDEVVDHALGVGRICIGHKFGDPRQHFGQVGPFQEQRAVGV